MARNFDVRFRLRIEQILKQVPKQRYIDNR